MKLPLEGGRVLALMLFAGSLTFGRTETGELNGAQYRIDIPDTGWNGSLDGLKYTVAGFLRLRRNSSRSLSNVFA